MVCQETPQRNGRPLVEQDPHSGHSSRRAPGDMLQHLPCLLVGDAREQLDELRQGDSVFEVLEQSRYGDMGSAEHPGTADRQGVALHGGAACPTEIGLCGHGQVRNLDPLIVGIPPLVQDAAPKPLSPAAAALVAEAAAGRRMGCRAGRSMNHLVFEEPPRWVLAVRA
jgi:hypothetical protein